MATVWPSTENEITCMLNLNNECRILFVLEFDDLGAYLLVLYQYGQIDVFVSSIFMPSSGRNLFSRSQSNASLKSKIDPIVLFE